MTRLSRAGYRDLTREMVCAAAVGLLLLSAPARAQTEIIYGSYNPPTATNSKGGAFPWLDEVKRLSNGSITYKFVGGGALVGTKTSLAGMRDGIVDAAMIVDLYYPSELPVSNVMAGLGSLLKDARVAIAAVTEVQMLHCPDCVKELEKYNVKFLGGYSTAAYNLLCTSPASSLAELKGKKIRAPGAIGRMATAIGAVPVNITVTETYEALQRGQIDCTFGAAGWLDTYSLGDVAKHVTLIKTGGAFGGPMFNLRVDKWKALKPAERKILLDAAPIGVAGASFAYEADDDVALSKASQKGYKVVEPSADLRAALEKFADEDAAVVIKQATGRGVKNAAAIIDAYRAANKKWTEIVAKVGNDKAAYIEALRREIYSKVNVN
jgi:TRAP-type transport system periplasmic protein